MFLQTIRVCTTMPAIIVSDSAVINLVGKTDKLFLGCVITKLDIVVYCDILLSMEDGIPVIKQQRDSCPINPDIKLNPHIFRLHIRQSDIKCGHLRGKIEIDTMLGRTKSDWLDIKIGHGDKTDEENEQYRQDLSKSIKKTAGSVADVDTRSDMVQPDVVEPIKPETLDALITIATNFTTIQLDGELKTCMYAEQYMATCSTDNDAIKKAIANVSSGLKSGLARSVKTIKPDILQALQIIRSSFVKISCNIELITCMKSLQILTRSHATRDEIIDAINMLV